MKVPLTSLPLPYGRATLAVYNPALEPRMVKRPVHYSLGFVGCEGRVNSFDIRSIGARDAKRTESKLGDTISSWFSRFRIAKYQSDDNELTALREKFSRGHRGCIEEIVSVCFSHELSSQSQVKQFPRPEQEVLPRMTDSLRDGASIYETMARLKSCRSVNVTSMLPSLGFFEWLITDTLSFSSSALEKMEVLIELEGESRLMPIRTPIPAPIRYCLFLSLF
ncbi:uncharacterized protein CLUP02_10899 [Colletotrichum lupini]|uniref:Uncharacterized protein n=1 Tax=Colletotrichum lupini TaxID=145971 RepID=A0A9Q8WJT0_9PEZI|nr:uncharacterized protein CLUP02_10899 [Colletotrichum lupini]UQC85402.1 hypothetical protein CLUP02_10899 [Colletotrichum lupini]